MALTWEVIPTFLNKERTRVSIIATATDSADPENPITVGVIKDALVDTETNKEALWANINDHYKRQILEASEEKAAVSALASEAKAGLEKL